jgi:hypothetical protein
MAAAQDYKVVLKDSGRVATGRFVSENDVSIVIEIGGMVTRFKKARLDLERMKELNRAPQPKPAQATPTTAAGERSKSPKGPFSIEETPEFRRAAKDQQRSLTNEIARLKNLLATVQAQPASPQRERDIEGVKAWIRQRERELEEFNLPLGESSDAEATRLRARMVEATRSVDREHREYFEALHRKASKGEMDNRLETLQRLQKEMGEANEAFSRYMRDRK